MVYFGTFDKMIILFRKHKFVIETNVVLDEPPKKPEQKSLSEAKAKEIFEKVEQQNRELTNKIAVLENEIRDNQNPAPIEQKDRKGPVALSLAIISLLGVIFALVKVFFGVP